MKQLLLMFCMLKKNKYILLVFPNIIQTEKQIILSMVPIRAGWHYLAVKKLSALLSAITSKHHSEFYCLHYLRSYTTEKKT